MKYKYFTKDANSDLWIAWENEPKKVFPLDRNEEPYFEAKGDFEVLEKFDFFPSKSLILIEVID